MIKTIFQIIICLIMYNVKAQTVFPYINNRDYLKSFHEGASTQLDFLSPIEIKYTDNIIAYIDSKRDLFVFDGKEKEKLSILVNDYKIGLNVVAWNSGPIINVWEDGQKQNLTYFGGYYEVSDSLVVFEDTRDNAIRVYYNGQIFDLFTSISRPHFPKYIGSNTVAFVGNGGVNYAFMAGEILEIGTFSENIIYSTGADLIVFNDPFNQSFACIFKNEILDVEHRTVKSYKAGYGIFVYLDINNDLKAYIEGELVDLSSYPTFYEVYRKTIVWGENGHFYTFVDGKRYEIANYIPNEYKIGDGIVVFRNLNGGVSAIHNKKVEIISNLTNAPFEINGNTVKIKVHRGNYDFFKNGYRYPTTTF